MTSRILPVLSIAAALCSTAAVAQDQNPAVAARQSHMSLYAHNLGIIGGMAQGNTEYDAEMAATAATDLRMLAEISEQAYWPEGTDSESIEGTRALPAIWEDMEGFDASRAALVEAAVAMEEAAGESLEALQGAMGGLGQGCGGCHQTYRQQQ
ncbi:c-type cytochrome [Pelagovum pacificum]|uniref:Cytochrome c n=1 Tax=Pelagovum pacificum TaxID=2588711 RepID=A0A5C5GC53_9RHOB|nr:cytochrome c [Pelagovum pacificum]QQA44662.1 cytochrome c [Pelagovum pacificum]TNY32228.1 cytochrome c [Pelagovum pacificum]